MVFKSLKNTKGSALLTALFIMTLAAIIATAMSMHLPIDIFRTKLIINQDKQYFANQAVTFWAIEYLNQKKIPHSMNENGEIAQFPKKLQNIYSEVILEGKLYDLQGRFNINNLRDSKLEPSFMELLQQTFPQLEDKEAKNMVKALKNWLLPYHHDKYTYAFEDYYKKQTPGYAAANQPLKSISELRLIKGFTQKKYQNLLPHIIALPDLVPININSAPKSLLKILGNGLSEQQVNAIIKARGEQGFKNQQIMHEVLKKLNIPIFYTTLESQYFLCIAKSTIKNSNLTKYIILKRNKSRNNKISINIISEYSNTL